MLSMGDDSEDEDMDGDSEEEDDDLTSEAGSSAAAAPKFAVGTTQRKGALTGKDSSTTALSALAAGFGAKASNGSQGDDGVAAQMGLGSGRSGRSKSSFLDAEEVAAGNLQVQQARRSGSKADKRKSRKEGRRAERGEASDAASTSTGQGSAAADDTYDFKSFF